MSNCHIISFNFYRSLSQIKYATKESTEIPMKFNFNPTEAICFIEMIRELITIAFGGVAIGNIKAKLAATVATIRSIVPSFWGINLANS